jgi:hypothetical protein
VPQPLVTDSVNVMRATSTSSNKFPHNKTVPFKPSQALSNGGRCHSDRVTDFLNRPAAHFVQPVEEHLIVSVDCQSHRVICPLRSRFETPLSVNVL